MSLHILCSLFDQLINWNHVYVYIQNNMQLKKRRRRSLTKLKEEDLVGILPQATRQSNTSIGYEGQYTDLQTRVPLDNESNNEQSISFHSNIDSPRIQSGSLESKGAIAGSKSDH